MAIPKEKNAVDSTVKGVQDRLLDAAEELFCEGGFEGTSVRDIAASAGCNVAAVNYYFGGKEKLYEEVWRRHLIPMRDARIAGIEKVLSQNEGQYWTGRRGIGQIWNTRESEEANQGTSLERIRSRPSI